MKYDLLPIDNIELFIAYMLNATIIRINVENAHVGSFLPEGRSARPFQLNSARLDGSIGITCSTCCTRFICLPIIYGIQTLVIELIDNISKL